PHAPAGEATAGLEGYARHRAVTAIYDFAWHELCDWYLEAVKPRLRDGDPAARAVAVHVIDVLLRALHPFMPFVTDELWSRLPVMGGSTPGTRDFLDRAAWPEPEPGFRDAEAEARVR